MGDSMRPDGYRGAWHGDVNLKRTVIDKLHKHHEIDAIVQGVYQAIDPKLATGFKGCAIGCTLPLRVGRFGEAVEPALGWHQTVEDLYGIDLDVAELIDVLFEEQDTRTEAANFAVAVIEAIPVGAELSQVTGRYWDEYNEADAADQELTSMNARRLIEFLKQAPVLLPVT